MKKIKLYDQEIAPQGDLLAIQEHRISEIDYIINNLFEFTNIFTGDNYEPTDGTGWNVTIQKGTDGKAVINLRVAELAADTDVEIDTPSASERTDIITASAALADDATVLRDFLDGTDPLNNPPVATSVVATQTWAPTFHYYSNTTSVPSGETLICTITVPAAATGIGDCTITDGRTIKPLDDLLAHKTASTLDHPDGSVLDQHINDAADIDLTKINGMYPYINLSEFLSLGCPTSTIINITNNTDGTIDSMGIVGDPSYTIDFNYTDTDITSIVQSASLSSGKTLTYTISFTWIAGNLTQITTTPVIA